MHLATIAHVASIADSGKVRLGAFAPVLATTTDAAKVRLGAFAPTLTATADAAKVRLGAFAPTCRRVADTTSIGQRRAPFAPLASRTGCSTPGPSHLVAIDQG